MLVNLTSLTKNNIDEICYFSWFYHKRLKQLKLSTIVPIVVYKIIKKDNIKSISLKDLKDKINFRYKKYFQHEKLFPELNIDKKITLPKLNPSNQISINNISVLKVDNYNDLVYNSITKYIHTLKEKSDSKKFLIKVKSSKKNRYNNKEKNSQMINKIYNQLSNETLISKEKYYNPVTYELNKCQEQCKYFIYNGRIEENSNINKNISLKEDIEIPYEKKFNVYFKDKVSYDVLGLGLIKYIIDKNQIVILSYKLLNEIFKCNIYQVKKCIIFINLYINYVNNL